MNACRVRAISEGFTLVDHGNWSEEAIDPALKMRVEEIWAAERARNPRLTNGSLLIFDRFEEPDGVSAYFAEYKYYLAQGRDPALYEKLGLNAVGVSGLVVLDDKILFAQRSMSVTAYPGFIELVPAGGITREFRLATGVIDYRRQLLLELEEESGIQAHEVGGVRPFLLTFDQRDRCYDIGMEITPNDKFDKRLDRFQGNREYDSFSWIARKELAEYLGAHARTVVPPTLSLLEAKRWL